jgi:hypothetical protein
MTRLGLSVTRCKSIFDEYKMSSRLLAEILSSASDLILVSFCTHFSLRFNQKTFYHFIFQPLNPISAYLRQSHPIISSFSQLNRSLHLEYLPPITSASVSLWSLQPLRANQIDWFEQTLESIWLHLWLPQPSRLQGDLSGQGHQFDLHLALSLPLPTLDDLFRWHLRLLVPQIPNLCLPQLKDFFWRSLKMRKKSWPFNRHQPENEPILRPKKRRWRRERK